MPDRASPDATVTGQLMLVLVVDDDPAISSLVAGICQDEGWATEVAEDGLAALELLDAGLVPQVIVTDLSMPRMDGRALLRTIRERRWVIPVLVLSAFGAHRAMRELGADAAIEKPFDINHLAATVQDLLRGRAQK